MLAVVALLFFVLRRYISSPIHCSYLLGRDEATKRSNFCGTLHWGVFFPAWLHFFMDHSKTILPKKPTTVPGSELKRDAC